MESDFNGLLIPSNSSEFPPFRARFVGRRIIKGSLLNGESLNQLCSDLKKSSFSKGSAGVKTNFDELRCSLAFTKKTLNIAYIRRDEGFESEDGDSSLLNLKQPQASASPLRTDSTGEDDLCSSDPENVNKITKVAPPSSPYSSSSTSSQLTPSSTTSSPTSDIKLRYSLDHEEAISLEDVLICHASEINGGRDIVWVARKAATKAKDGSQLEALVFECASEGEAKDLAKKFLEIRQRLKFDKRSVGAKFVKTNGIKAVATATAASTNTASSALPPSQQENKLKTSALGLLFGRGKAVRGQKSKPKNLQLENKNVFVHNSTTSTNLPVNSNVNPEWNLIRYTDKNGITRIEVESTAVQQLRQQQQQHQLTAAAGGPPQQLQLLRGQQLQQQNSKSVIEIKAGENGGVKSSSSNKILGNPEKSRFASELELILSKNLKESETKDSASSDEKSAIQKSDEKSGEGAASSSVLSMRQRAPAMLLPEAVEQREKKLSSTQSEIGGLKNPQRFNPSKIASRTPPPISRKNHEFWRAQRRSGDQNGGHNQVQINSQVITPHQPPPKIRSVSPPPNVGNVENSNPNSTKSKQILVPTKTGKEQPKPRPGPSIPPPSLVPPGPMSLPPVGGPQPPFGMHLPPPPMGWPQFHPAHFPFRTEFNPLDPGTQSMLQQQHLHWLNNHQPPRSPAATVSQGSRGRSRERSRLLEMSALEQQKRRAQSKSPARRVNSNEYHPYNNHESSGSSSDFSAISRRLKEFGDVLRGKSKKNQNEIQPSTLQPQPVKKQLKSNLKKQDNNLNNGGGPSASFGAVTISGATSIAIVDGMTSTSATENETSSGDQTDGVKTAKEECNKKVHFNKFATVQMME